MIMSTDTKVLIKDVLDAVLIHYPNQHLDYIKSLIRCLKDNPSKFNDVQLINYSISFWIDIGYARQYFKIDLFLDPDYQFSFETHISIFDKQNKKLVTLYIDTDIEDNYDVKKHHLLFKALGLPQKPQYISLVYASQSELAEYLNKHIPNSKPILESDMSSHYLTHLCNEVSRMESSVRNSTNDQIKYLLNSSFGKEYT
jgi:hypothetical protein